MSKKYMCRTVLPMLTMVSSFLFQANTSVAMEGGGTSYPLGVEQHMLGAVPKDPGFYNINYVQHYTAHRLRGNSGAKAVDDFDLRAEAFVSRLVYVSNKELFGGRVAGHIVVPYVNLDVKLNGRTDTDKGIGDSVFGFGLAYDYSPELHAAYVIDITMPTGRYDSKKLANVGRNYWVAQPLAAITYVQPEGINWDIKAMYNFNFENHETDYKSGQEFLVDYDFGWGFAKHWVAGVGGFLHMQTTDDRIHGEKVHDNKARAFAIGPSVKYAGDGWFVSAKWQQESKVRNRTEGSAFWLKAAIPLPF